MPAKPARKKRTQPKATDKLKALRAKRDAKEQGTKARSHEGTKGKKLVEMTEAQLKSFIDKGKISVSGGSPVNQVARCSPIKPHPFANLLPMMSAQEFDALTADIKANGLRESGVIFEGMLLDGRNRQEACDEAGVPFTVREFDPAREGSALSYIVSKATHRNMSETQKACAAVNVMDVFEQQAADRMRGGEPVPQGEKGKSRDKAGAVFGVSGRYIQDAKLLKEKAPDLFSHAFEGRQPLSQLKRAYQRSLKLADLNKKAKTHAAAVSVKTDQWQIITGDCIEELDKLDARPRLIFADPPYNLGFDYGNGAKADSLPESQYLSWCAQWIERCAEQLADDGSLFVMIDAAHQAELFGLLSCGGHFRNTILWHETFGSYTDNNFTSCARFIHYFTRHKSRFVFNGDSIRIPSDRQAKYEDKRADPAGKVPGNVWREFPRLVDNAAERMPGFPTQVPLALMERIIKVASEPGDLVLDPFNGSGTTGHAALLHGRRYLGIEQIEANAAFARARLMNVQMEKKKD